MASMSSKFEVTKFDGTGNFGLWQTRVQDLLAQQGILKALKGTKPAKVDDEKWEEMQEQAAATIRLCLSDQIMYLVMDEMSPKKIWEKLGKQFMSKTLTHKLYLKQRLYGLKMQEGSDLAEHINVFNQVVADLVKVDVKLDDEDKAIILLCSLPSSYEHVVTTLTYGKSEVTVDEITTALLARDQRRKNNSSDDSSTGDALVVRSDHGREAEKRKKNKGPQCYKCKEWGHVRRDCPELKRKKDVANVVVSKKDDSESDSDVLVLSSEKSCGEAWLLDSASSFHATSRKEWFSSYVDGDFGFAHLGDDTGHRIMGVGKIKFTMYDGQEVLLEGVRHVPRLRKNLISLGILHEEGWLYQAAPDRRTLRVMQNGKTVMIGEKSDANHYRLKGRVMEDGAAGITVFGPDGGKASTGCSR